ncbi:MAG TPA: NUDIX hydrolase [Deltaproteobacteria bacterium]|nr:MAG: NUDIX hydrolase [Deltaproteobacteria bacterium GWA2_55_82]OGQ64169.1 MAG: NUDIX hydrolase [Deltaproteobacteria bacterium RIFCSPLOWO2_02_FULL_55_12]OIJ74622.1 MAG: NUDIX hydrolase [Deltaproteobacteria bacterium GWC2_55_46]HBG46434.1 NUDIX hydrolase [Deltaproteobacteria bacterium]HCY10646.1 NUDIX hydrolase [Deltaproteobacteria bacterium]
MPAYRNPAPTVDIIVEIDGGIVLIQRKNPPDGWALPGGFVDYGESLEEAARREAWEETSLAVRLKCQMHAYSDPARDPRKHTLSVVFVAEAEGEPVAMDDAKGAGVFTEGTLPGPIAFDHARIISEYFRWKREGWKVFEY